MFLNFFFFFFLLMENLGAMAYSRYTGFCEITDRDVLELHCILDFMSTGTLQESQATPIAFR